MAEHGHPARTPSRRGSEGRPDDGEVVGLGSAGGEHYLLRLAPDRLGDVAACLLQARASSAAKAVRT